jgi:hypothetical protein
MAVAFRAAATGTKTGGSGLNLVINVPAGTADGDVMVAMVLTGTGTTAATQASWTTLDSQTTGPTARSFYRIASSEPASYTFTVVDAQTSTGAIVTYSGSHATTPINQHAAYNRLTSTTSISATTVTPSVDNCMIVFLGGAGAAASATPPSGYTERADISQGGITVEAAELLQTTAAATGTVTATASASTNTQGTVVAIAPPTAATGSYQPGFGFGFV